MTRGVYTKNGEHIEIVVGDGITEIMPPIPMPKDVDALFYFMPRPERKHKSLFHKFCILASMAAPLVATEIAASTSAAFEPLYLAALAWCGIVIYANTRG